MQRETIGVRLGEQERAILEEAAAIRGVPFTTFVRNAAITAAEEALAAELSERRRRLLRRSHRDRSKLRIP